MLKKQQKTPEKQVKTLDFLERKTSLTNQAKNDKVIVVHLWREQLRNQCPPLFTKIYNIMFLTREGIFKKPQKIS